MFFDIYRLRSCGSVFVVIMCLSMCLLINFVGWFVIVIGVVFVLGIWQVGILFAL